MQTVYSQTKAFTVKQINEKQLMISMYKSHHNLLPDSLLSFFIRQSDIVNRQTRAKTDNFYVYPPRLEITKRSILHQGLLLWNESDGELRNVVSLSTFKQQLKSRMIASLSVSDS